MQESESTIERLRKCESLVDNALASSVLPGMTWGETAWCLLTVCDDMQRFGLIGASMKPHDEFVRVGQAVVFQLVDELKYALRHALLVTRKLPNNDSFCKQELDEERHNTAGTMLMLARDYGKISRYFAMCYEGSAHYRVPNEQTLELVARPDQLRYSALEGLLSVFGKGRTSFLSTFYNWVIAGAAPNGILEAANFWRPGQSFITCAGSATLVRASAQAASGDETLIPSEWSFPWGGTPADTLWFLSILHSTALLHATLVHVTQYGRAPDHGAAELCMTIDRGALLRHLAESSGLNDEFVAGISDALTYGERMTAPDPILQPLIPLGGEILGLGTLTTMGSDIERNILSLHSRYDKRSFDAQSRLFEQKMTDELVSVLANTPFSYWRNITFSASDKREEIDVVLMDRRERSITLLELRWMLPPGDPREVMNRIRVCSEKAQQLERKVDFVRANIRKVLETIGMPSGEDDWKVDGAVVLDGYAGRELDDYPRTTLVPLELVRQTIVRFRSLTSWISWLQAKDWLPQEGREFDVVPQTTQFGPVRAESPHALLSSNASYFSSPSSSLGRSLAVFLKNE